MFASPAVMLYFEKERGDVENPELAAIPLGFALVGWLVGWCCFVVLFPSAFFLRAFSTDQFLGPRGRDRGSSIS